MGENEFVVFVVVHEYSPKDSEIELKVGDQFYVKKPIIDPLGWLEGVNMRTRSYGRFPGNYCTIINENAMLPRPPKPKSGFLIFFFFSDLELLTSTILLSARFFFPFFNC